MLHPYDISCGFTSSSKLICMLDPNDIEFLIFIKTHRTKHILDLVLATHGYSQLQIGKFHQTPYKTSSKLVKVEHFL